MTPDLIILNGRLITFDKNQPAATALAIHNGRISAVGETADIRAMAGPDTRKIDAGAAPFFPALLIAMYICLGGLLNLITLIFLVFKALKR